MFARILLLYGAYSLMQPEEAWLLIMSQPSEQTVLRFLEEDLDLGMRVAWEAEIEWKATRTVSIRVYCAMEAVQDDVVRWLKRAKVCGIPIGPLQSRLEQFARALYNVREQRSGHDCPNQK